MYERRNETSRRALTVLSRGYQNIHYQHFIVQEPFISSQSQSAFAPIPGLTFLVYTSVSFYRPDEDKSKRKYDIGINIWMQTIPCRQADGSGAA